VVRARTRRTDEETTRAVPDHDRHDQRPRHAPAPGASRSGGRRPRALVLSPPAGGRRQGANPTKETAMPGDHVYRKSELVGSSRESVSHAIETAIERASRTIRHVEWFEVTEIRGHVQNGKIGHYQVAMNIGFRVDDD
jgi:hypothetical protein